MKKQLITALIMAISINSTIAQLPKDYEVATWLDFKKSAVTYSFDDGTPNQLPIAVPLLNKYGFKASFNLVIDWVKDWNDWKQITNNGHEIASHTITHANFGQISEEQQRKELETAKQIIEEKIGKPCITFVYPYCARGNDNIVAEYYISARTCDRHVAKATPENMFDITSVCVGAETDVQKADDFNKWVKNGVIENGWLTFLIHAIDNDGGYSSISSTEFDNHLKFVSENQNDYWVATFAEVSKYILERNSLSIKEKKVSNGYEIEVMVSAQSKITKFDQPLTIKRSLPKKWTSAKVTNSKGEINSRIENNKLIFNIIPGEKYTITE
ncbi:MAG: polysaccharide deacetylase family protein [Bacteroidales bacterium]|nr:polysaccharide deacetylase family protein [Bacteroidales bacterium]